ncbi:hypothetical protein NJF44_04105 [Pseudomonas guariconensis]|nr:MULTISPECIES: hypothetical protein [Pseudomonas]MCO7593531.1 hypothetical protein [Pseudomonas guariconensis]MCO7604418.1 hypothetical protein [Pseudomonas guariconensis]MCO7630597.1 hypothetical protein [Pseudomonas guariconensis]MCU7219161.1 hypothetical protein [Pseudomonas brassicacearum]
MKRCHTLPMIVLSLATSMSACAQERPAATEPLPEGPHVTLSERRLTLENHQGRCALRSKTDQTLLQLEIPWPCQFSPDRRSGEPRVEHFNGAQIIIVRHIDFDTPTPGSCRSQYQAIRWFNNQLEPSVVAHSASCTTGAVDQKNFVGLFKW